MVNVNDKVLLEAHLISGATQVSYLACATEGKMEMIAWSCAEDAYPRMSVCHRARRTPGTHGCRAGDHGAREETRSGLGCCSNVALFFRQFYILGES